MFCRDFAAVKSPVSASTVPQRRDIAVDNTEHERIRTHYDLKSQLGDKEGVERISRSAFELCNPMLCKKCTTVCMHACMCVCMYTQYIQIN